MMKDKNMAKLYKMMSGFKLNRKKKKVNLLKIFLTYPKTNQ